MARWLWYMGLMLLLFALITSPTEKEFKAYIYAKSDSTICKPGFQFNNYKLTYFQLFSIISVTKCDEHRKGNKSQTGLADKAGISAIRQEKYLGLFGMFWKL